MEAVEPIARVRSLLTFVLILSGLIIETHSLPNAHSLLPLQLIYVAFAVRSSETHSLPNVHSLLPWQLHLLCLARRSLGEGGSLIPFAPLLLRSWDPQSDSFG